LDPIPEQDLDSAKELIKLEYEQLMQEKTHPLLAEGKTSYEAMEMILTETANSTKAYAAEVFFQNSWKDAKSDEKLLAESLALEFDTLQEATSTLRTRNEKTESKIAVLTGGFAKRAQNTTAEILQLYHNLQNAAIEEAVYEKLRDHEERGGAARIDQLRSAIIRLRQDEERLQGVFNSMQPQQTSEN
jgi:hypothetical protein